MRARLVSILALSLAAGAVQAQVKLNEITSVSVKDEGTRIAVVIQGSRPPNFTTFSMADPPRFVIDLSESRFQGVPPDIDVGDGFVNVIKNLSYGSELTSIARVMVAFAVEVDPPETPETTGNTLIVRFAKPAGAAAVAKAEESDKRAKEEAEAKARAEAEAKARAEAEAKARADAEARASAQVAEKARAEQDAAAATAAAAAKADQERSARELADAKAAEEAAAQAAAEARAKEIKARAELAQGGGAPPADDEKLQGRTPDGGRAEQEKLAKERAAAEAKAEAERKAQELAEVKAKAEEDRKAREADRLAKLDAERQAREQAAADKKASAEQAAADKRAAAEQAAADKKAAAEQAAAEKKATAEQAAAEKKAAAERKKQEIADAKARAEDDRKARAEQARLEREAARTAASERASSSAPIARLKEIGFKQLPGTSRVYVRTDVTPRFTIQDVGEDVVRVEFENTRAARRNDTRFMDTSFFQSAVALITPSKKGDSYVVDIKLKQRVPYQQKVEGDLLAIDFERPPGAADPAGTAPAAAEPAGDEPPAEPPAGGPLK
jgi:colicin import membrane protein